jgi:hypothetical protein
MNTSYKKASFWIQFKIFIYGWFQYFYTENTSFETHLKLQIWADIVTGNLTPKTCEWCCSQSFKDIPKDYVNYDLCEFERQCECCDKLVGYWSYGHWQC